MKKILIIEDDELLNTGICYNLEAIGMISTPVYTIKDAKKKLSMQSWDLIVLDVNLPDGDGFTFFESVHYQINTPIIFLTARDLDDDILKGLSLGADDYITKPFHVKIFIEKVKCILRRCNRYEQEEFSYEGLSINFTTRTAKKYGVTLELTPTEYKLIYIFMHHPGQILTRNSLIEALWDIDGDFVDEHALTIQVSRLRSKLQDEKHEYIKTVYGLGYQWIKNKDR